MTSRLCNRKERSRQGAKQLINRAGTCARHFYLSDTALPREKVHIRISQENEMQHEIS
jgi:hypothetical protein